MLTVRLPPNRTSTHHHQRMARVIIASRFRPESEFSHDHEDVRRSPRSRLIPNPPSTLGDPSPERLFKYDPPASGCGSKLSKPRLRRRHARSVGQAIRKILLRRWHDRSEGDGRRPDFQIAAFNKSPGLGRTWRRARGADEFARLPLLGAGTYGKSRAILPVLLDGPTGAGAIRNPRRRQRQTRRAIRGQRRN